MNIETITPRMVESVPEDLEDGILYVSLTYNTAIHKCCCGCGEEVVTPLTPAHWEIQIIDNLVTLFPSIGNWDFPCKSHYWIKRNRVIWSYAFTAEEIERVKQEDKDAQEQYIAARNAEKIPSQRAPIAIFLSLWLGLKRWWKGLFNSKR